MKRYADDYETVVTVDENGKEKRIAVYHGDYYEIGLESAGILQFKKSTILLLAAFLVFHISAGFVGNQGSYQFFIALPYVLAFFPLIYLTAGVFHLPKEKRKFRRDEIGLSFDRMKKSSFAILIFLTMGVLGEIAYLLFFQTQRLLSTEFLYLALEVLAVVAVYFIIRLQKPILIQIVKEKQN